MLASSISQLIESCGLCQAGEVKAIQTMKAGMTNRSYTFFVKEKLTKFLIIFS